MAYNVMGTPLGIAAFHGIRQLNPLPPPLPHTPTTSQRSGGGMSPPDYKIAPPYLGYVPPEGSKIILRTTTQQQASMPPLSRPGGVVADPNASLRTTSALPAGIQIRRYEVHPQASQASQQQQQPPSPTSLRIGPYPMGITRMPSPVDFTPPTTPKGGQLPLAISTFTTTSSRRRERSRSTSPRRADDDDEYSRKKKHRTEHHRVIETITRPPTTVPPPGGFRVGGNLIAPMPVLPPAAAPSGSSSNPFIQLRQEMSQHHHGPSRSKPSSYSVIATTNSSTPSSNSLIPLQRANTEPRAAAAALANSIQRNKWRIADAYSGTGRSYFFVFDTCSFLHLGDIEEKLDALTYPGSSWTLGVPFSVLDELDGMIKGFRHAQAEKRALLKRQPKDNPDAATVSPSLGPSDQNGKAAARGAAAVRVRDWINKRLESHQIRLQQRSEVDHLYNMSAQNADDRILGFAVFLKREKLVCAQIVFVTEDIMLTLKAKGEKFPTASVTDLFISAAEQQEVNKKKQQASSNSGGRSIIATVTKKAPRSRRQNKS